MPSGPLSDGSGRGRPCWLEHESGPWADELRPPRGRAPEEFQGGLSLCDWQEHQEGSVELSEVRRGEVRARSGQVVE